MEIIEQIKEYLRDRPCNLIPVDELLGHCKGCSLTDFFDALRELREINLVSLERIYDDSESRQYFQWQGEIISLATENKSEG